jgi:Golgi phosphoprotein 3 (GPP34)
MPGAQMPGATPGLHSLGEDLLLLSVKPNGAIGVARITVGLAGSELVRLAVAGRVEVVDGQVIVRSAAWTGDPDLDRALHGILTARRPTYARSFVEFPRRGIRDAYLARLTGTGVLAVAGHSGPRFQVMLAVAGHRAVLGGPRFQVTDPRRLAWVRAALDGIAYSQGPVTVASAAFGGLTYAIGLDRLLYPGSPGRAARERLKEIASGQWTAAPFVPDPAGAMLRAAGPGRPGDGDGDADADGAHGHGHSTPDRQGAYGAPDMRGAPGTPDVHGAAQAAADAAAQAAADAAVQAAVHAATAAATHAAVHAAHSSGHSGGHDGGGHSGGGGGHH